MSLRKTVKEFLGVIVLFVVIIAGGIYILFISNHTKYKDFAGEAKVLTINEHILEGQMIGSFLSSPDGWIKDDIIKVSIEITDPLNNNLILCDLKLSHAELSYYKNQSTLPIKVKYRTDLDNNIYVKVYLNRRVVHDGILYNN